MIRKIYRAIIRDPLRLRIHDQWLSKIRRSRMRRRILRVSPTVVVPSSERKEYEEVSEYFRLYGPQMLPFYWTDEYSELNIMVFRDSEKKLHYTLMDGKKLYWPRGMHPERIRRIHLSLQLEQDSRSPHCYLSKEFTVNEGDVLLDVGAAEGYFSLAIVEKVKQLYLFEGDAKWIEPLRETFKPWEEKVTIVPKFVSNINDTSNVTIDSFLSSAQEVNFIKVDAEGAERLILAGATSVLRHSTEVHVVVCTYHLIDDADIIPNLLGELGFKVGFSAGFVIAGFEKGLNPYEYIRKALVRATKHRDIEMTY